MLYEVLVRHARRVVVFVVGGTVVLLGIVMVIGPGPGIVTVFAGLGILAIEFAWAKRLLDRAKKAGEEQVERYAPAWANRWMQRLKAMTARRRGDGLSGDGRCCGGEKDGPGAEGGKP